MDYIIATMPRTGSNFLCELLARNGCGAPAEDFSIFARASPFGAALARGSSTEEYLNNFFYKRRSVHGLFATKIMGDWMDVIRANMASPTYNWKSMFQCLFPKTKFIFLTRRDKLKQAISFQKAFHTQQWRKTENEQEVSIEESLSPRKIQTILHHILINEQKWCDIFHECAIEPYHLVYEDYTKDLAATITDISDFIGRKVTNPRIESKTCSIQWSDINQQTYNNILDFTLEARGQEKEFLEFITKIYS